MVASRRVVAVALDVAIVVALVLVSVSLLNDFDVALPVEGISMLPTIHTGDLAIVLPTTLQSLHVGDIVVYRYGTEMIIHRIVSTHFNSPIPYVTVKGDNNPYPDPSEVTQSVLVGKVDALILGFGYVTSQTAKIAFALALFILIVLDYFVGSGGKGDRGSATGRAGGGSAVEETRQGIAGDLNPDSNSNQPNNCPRP